MLSCRNAEGVDGQRKVGKTCPKLWCWNLQRFWSAAPQAFIQKASYRKHYLVTVNFVRINTTYII